jgi:hypothetical protein
MVDVNVKTVFLPLKYHSQKVQSFLKLSNDASEPLNFKVRTTHPRDVVAEPPGGLIQPSDTVEVLIWWNPETAIRSVDDFQPLNPPKQPKLQIETKSLDTSKSFKPIIVPISFAIPAEGDEYHYKVGAQVFSSFVKSLTNTTYNMSKAVRTQATWSQVLNEDRKETPKENLPVTNYQRSKQERYFRPRQLDFRNGELERQGFLKQRQVYQVSLKRTLSEELRERNELAVRERAVDQMKVMMEQVYAYHLLSQSHTNADKKECCVIS